MRRALLPPMLLAAFVLAVGTSLAPAVYAQDRPDDHHDQSTNGHETRPSDEQRGHAVDEHAPPAQERVAPEERRGAEERRDTEERRPPEEHRGGPEDLPTLRRAHPHSSARCHDGFFTSTRDRARACSRHGGIDIWLAL